MSEVKRYKGMNVGLDSDCILAADYDASLAREAELEALVLRFIEQRDQMQAAEAALREELAELGERYSKLQTGEDSMLHRVIAERDAAEQRNAEAEALLHAASLRLATWLTYHESPRAEIIGFLTKPTESGASE